MGDEVRELRERGLEASEADGARVEGERARLVILELEAL
jgi:hypothetical protein